MPLHKAIFIEPGVSGAKYALSRLGRVASHVRLPLTTLDINTQKAIDAALEKLGLCA
jgi:4-hydroxy-tetrahydrodipicolinate synthase